MENYLMNYDEKTGEIKGFYLKSIHGNNVPFPTIEITPERHEFYMQYNGKYKLNPETLEDELIVEPELQLQPPTQEDRLNAVESAISAIMGV